MLVYKCILFKYIYVYGINDDFGHGYGPPCTCHLNDEDGVSTIYYLLLLLILLILLLILIFTLLLLFNVPYILFLIF